MTFQTLHSGSGAVPGERYLPSRGENVHWGWLPNAATPAALTVEPGTSVTIDTLSHEGLLEDQGRDPVSYLRQFGVSEVLDDAREIAAGDLHRDEESGPHIVTGPIHITSARPGDVLRVDILELALRVPYGFVSSRHGFGALPGEFPEFDDSQPTRQADALVSNGTVSHFSWVEDSPRGLLGKIAAGRGRTVEFPLAPFLGLMGVARATDDLVHSVPPGDHGGNIDVKHAIAGTSLYLPVQVDGAQFYSGDPHFAQGNGEVALTALEASLRATLRFEVLRGAEARAAIGSLSNPVIETSTHWVPTGMDADLNEAMRKATRNAVAFLSSRFDVPRDVAYAYLSAGADFEVSQVVDAVTGVHCMIRKADFAHWV